MGSVLAPSRPSGTVTMEEVEKHNTLQDGWIVLFGEAIDVTRFIPIHPGGASMMDAYLGKDATVDWQEIHEAGTLDRPEIREFLTKMGKVEIGVRGDILSWLLRKVVGPSYSGATSYSQRSEATNGPLPKWEEDEAQNVREAQDAAANREGPEEQEPVRWGVEYEAELPPGGVFDLQELSRWDGVDLPMCVGICGLVLDVSNSDNFRPGFGYGKLWAGRDTTYAMATVSLKAHDANNLDFALGDLSSDQFAALAGWYKHFTHKYRQVGTLRELQGRDFSSVEEKAREMKLSSMSQTGGEKEEARGA